MSETEFDIIGRYFRRQPVKRKDVLTGIGDDAAVLHLPVDRELLLCIDTLVAGVHFPAGTPAAAIGHKALAVNLSDLAAMGAEAAWATLALTLPEPDPVWLEAFSGGFFALAGRHRVQLVGGDTTRGPLTVTVQAHGFAPQGQALRRTGARPGDRIYVTGTLGDAGLALHLRDAAAAELRVRLDYPEPRLDAGSLLRGLASAVIDISDGLLADLGHLLEDKGLGASLQVDGLPRSRAFIAALQGLDAAPAELYYELPLSGGDDYELCFTVPEHCCAEVERRLGGLSCGCTAIGTIEAQPGIRCCLQDGGSYQPAATGYLHFQGGDHD
ncbi:MAG: thiamine-phosphate kinase [Gammaproteobacteria bacterium]|jgi:thiamine-monophosphate kinase